MYKAASFGEFAVDCARDGVFLDSALIDRVIASAQKPKDSPGAFRDPRNMIAATRTAARMRQQHPEQPLATGRVDTERLFGDDHFAAALGRLINNDGAPNDVTPLELPSEGYKYSPNCSKTEPNFGGAVRRLAKDPATAPVQVIVDHDGKPVAMRKGGRFGAGTALTFQPTKTGIYAPAGWVARIDVVGDTPDTKLNGTPRITTDMPRIISVDDVTNVSYLRPSAFGTPGQQRPEHFGLEPIELISLNVGKIATMAQTAVERLG